MERIGGAFAAGAAKLEQFMKCPARSADKHVAILTEAGGTVGFGHLARMDELARGIEAVGHEVSFIVQWEAGPNPHGPIERQGIRFEKWRSVSRVADLCDADVAVIDSYLLPPHVYTTFAKAGTPIIAIDDFYRFDCDEIAFINPNCFGDPSRYPRARAVFTGSEHVIVRRAVLARRTGSRPARVPGTVLVTLGGADRTGFGVRAGRWLADAGYRVGVIQSNNALQTVAERGMELISHCDEATFINKLLAAELVVCGGGQTLIESLVLGCNVVPVEMGECHRPMIHFLLEAGFLDERIHFTMAAAQNKLLRAAASATAAAASTRGPGSPAVLIDGEGTRRIVSAIDEMLLHSGRLGTLNTQSHKRAIDVIPS